MTSPDAPPPPFQPPFQPPSQQPFQAPFPPPQASPYAPTSSPSGPSTPSPYAPASPTPPWTAPSSSGGGSTRVIAVIALIAAIVAFLLALATLVVVLVASGTFDSSYKLTGTAPQVVDGEPYPGTALGQEITRVIEDDGGDVSAISCPDTAVVDSGATTTCTATVDDWKETITVDFEDGAGHFTLTEQDAE